MTEPVRIAANLRADVEFVEPETFVSVRQFSDDDRRQLGLNAVPINPELTEGIVGHGKAKCRKDDHFEHGIGLEIAAARALIDYGQQCEERATLASRTERQFQADAAAEALGEIAELFSQSLGVVARSIQRSAL